LSERNYRIKRRKDTIAWIHAFAGFPSKAVDKMENICNNAIKVSMYKGKDA
jgi:hypothetical protein